MAKLSNPSVTDEQIIQCYQEYLSAYKVASVLLVSNKRVYRVLGKAGIQPTGLQHYRQDAQMLSPEDQAEIARLYAAGSTTPNLQEQFSCTRFSVIRAIERNGGKMRPSGGTKPRRFLNEDEISEICRLYDTGISQTSIAGMMKSDQGVISRVLRKAGKESRGPKRARRKDGRRVAGLYVRILLDKSDPFWNMCDRHSTVMEHRLVVARWLGRPLLESETVHHINGIHDDNRLENLQLRQGKHGKGVVMCCLDCGSHRIGPIPISET